VFLENLLPFILTEKLRKYILSEEIVRKIIDFYREKKDYDNLEKVILCLTFENE